MWRRYLMWFAHEHIDFRHAVSLILIIFTVYINCSNVRVFVLNNHVIFQEMQSILSMLNMPIKFIEKPCVRKPYWIVELPSEDCVRKIASRSVLIKNCIELWSTARTQTQLHINLKNSLKNSTGGWVVGDIKDNDTSDTHLCPKELIESCCSTIKTYKVEVETFCKHFSMKEKVHKIEVRIIKTQTSYILPQ